MCDCDAIIGNLLSAELFESLHNTKHVVIYIYAMWPMELRSFLFIFFIYIFYVLA